MWARCSRGRDEFEDEGGNKFPDRGAKRMRINADSENIPELVQLVVGATD